VFWYFPCGNEEKQERYFRIVDYCGWDSNQPTPHCDTNVSHLSPLAQSVSDTVSVVWNFWLYGIAECGRKFLQ